MSYDMLSPRSRSDPRNILQLLAIAFFFAPIMSAGFAVSTASNSTELSLAVCESRQIRDSKVGISILVGGKLCARDITSTTCHSRNGNAYKCDSYGSCNELPPASVAQATTPRTDELVAAIASNDKASLAQSVAGFFLELSMIVSAVAACYRSDRISPLFSLAAATMLATSTALVVTSVLLDGAMSSWFESVRGDGEPLQVAAFQLCDSALSRVYKTGLGQSMRLASGALSLALWLLLCSKLRCHRSVPAAGPVVVLAPAPVSAPPAR